MKKESRFILGENIDLHDLYEVAAGGAKVELSQKAKIKLEKIRKELMTLISSGNAFYGINTGFGELASKKIEPSLCRQLQVNLVRSHACGAGNPMDDAQARGLMFLRANELTRGHSGVRPVVVETMVKCLNKGVIPFIPSRGSVGASGDLAPSAHCALVLLGEGMARICNKETDTNWMPSAAALKKAGIKPIKLEEKEGLSLINGTQAMQSVGGISLTEATATWTAANMAAAMSVEALKATPTPFCKEVNALKRHDGQNFVAEILSGALKNSEIRKSHIKNDPRVQDPYSIRCIPQVHGAAFDALMFAIDTVETEMMSATDNPVLSWKESGGKIKNLNVLSGGNFHGQSLSLAFDTAASAMAFLGNISERRTAQMISAPGGVLPPFLARNAGVESGFMIAQYLAASLASENKTLAHPACVDSIPTSANKEDFVSMGMWSAIKFDKIIYNAAGIIAVELLAGTRGLEFHRPLKPSKKVEEIYGIVREIAGKTEGDIPLSEPIEKLREAVLTGIFC